MVKLWAKDLPPQKIPPVGFKVKCSVCHVSSINNFFVQAANENTADRLDDPLKYLEARRLEPVLDISVGEVLIDENESFGVCRCVIKSLNEQSQKYILFFPDFGATIEKDVSNCKFFPMVRELMFESLGYRASLHGVVPVEGCEQETAELLKETADNEIISGWKFACNGFELTRLQKELFLRSCPFGPSRNKVSLFVCLL